MTDFARPERYLGAVRRILALQDDDGRIPWTECGVFDPWNHIESAMALGVMGETAAARGALEHLRRTQNSDGSWWADYGNAAPVDEDRQRMAAATQPPLRDTNHAAYVVMGVLHDFLCTNDLASLKRAWPMAEAALEFAVRHQTQDGDIRWAGRDPHTPQDDALLTGCSSIYKSLAAGLRLADILGLTRPDWARARDALGAAIREKPQRFDRTWPSNARFSMDWYYPVLCGAIDGRDAEARIADRWETFVVDGLGCRCVEEEPWVTAAEACELSLALLRIGDRTRAEAVFQWQDRCRDADGAYWMGWQFRNKVFWPVDKPSWTAAAIILAADALYGFSSASGIFLNWDVSPALPRQAAAVGRAT
ncbi:MAG: prenyltransferase [Pseudomonadota bacterium]